MSAKAKVAVLLANLGTPDAPSAEAVRTFLAQFLSDQRVIELPKLLWQIILRSVVLPFRPAKVAKAYAAIWQDDSPMRRILLQQVQLVQSQLVQEFDDLDIDVIGCMSYGNPNIQQALAQVAKQGHDHIVLLPLFPQFSATSTAPLYDAIAKWVLQQRKLPGISLIRDYYAHPLYIAALAESVRQFQAKHGPAEKLLMSFHGIPQPYADKGDPYATRCRDTAARLAAALGLTDAQWAIAFQSRFGRQEWVKPYTNQLLVEWAQQGVQSVHIISPAFSADCLETLEELAVENRAVYLGHGGRDYAYIPALNISDSHIMLLLALLRPQLQAVRSQFSP
jgi:ferrochelatase